MKNKEDIVGKTNFDMSCDTTNAVQFLQNED